MLSKSYKNYIRAKNSKKNGQLKKLKKSPKWLFPLSPERHYTKELYQYTLQIRRIIAEQVYPRLPFWLSGGTITYPDPVIPARKDSLIDDIISQINQTMDIVNTLLNPFKRRATQAAVAVSFEVAAFNKIQYEKTINSVLGVDIFQEEPWLETQLELFANQNAELITGMTEEEIKRVSGHIQRGLQEGSSYESIADEIQESFGITRRKAKLIARDQTSKLNASLTKLRQQEVGIERYEWQTSGDERVRPSHKVLDGKICRWDDPTVFLDEQTGKWKKRSTIGGTQVHTGQDINCRCQPLGIIEDIFG